MTKPIINRREIVKRLKAQGWISIGGGDHENFEKAGHRLIQVPAIARLPLALGGRSQSRGLEMTGRRRINMTRYFGLLDGRDGAFGVVFPDVPGCTAMGRTEDAAIAKAVAALGEWHEHTARNRLDVPVPRKLTDLRTDPDVVEAMQDGAVLVSIPLIQQTAKSVRANISVDAGVLDAIDTAAGRAGLTRSAFLIGAAMDKIKASA